MANATQQIRVYLMGGQSNMVGVAPVSELPTELRLPQQNVMIFARGELEKSYNGQFGWAPVQPELGYLKEAFGPEISFARDMANAHPGETIGLIKCAWGGTNLQYEWRPPSSGGQTGELYQKFVQAVLDGLVSLKLKGFDPVVSGMIWMQGEADALEADMYSDYEKNLANLISDLRRELNLPQMPFVLGQIIDCDTYKPPKWGAEVRQAQLGVADRTPNTAIFDTSDYKLIDPWHYDAPSMLSLGSRFAEGILKLENNI